MKLTNKQKEQIAKYLSSHGLTADGAIKILGRSSSSKSKLFGSDIHVGRIYAL